MTFRTNIPTVEPERPTPMWTPNTWVKATWEAFRAIADHPDYAKAVGYYFNDHMRIETMGIGPNHAVDNSLIHVAIALYCALKGIPLRSLINASYCKLGCQEAQPDSSYYINDKAQAVPDSNSIIDLDVYPVPDLVLEVAATSLNDDLGVKRLLYEELGVREYWVVDVSNARIFAFEIVERGSQRLTRSKILPGLEIALLEVALRSRTAQDDSQIMAQLMTQFSL